MRPFTYSKLIAPGVALQDIAPTPRQDLLTGIPVFLGVIQGTDTDTDLSTPKKLTLWPQFAQQFNPPPGSYLAYAVRGFFENGGRLCYVQPLQNYSAAALQAGLQAIEALNVIDLVCAPDIMCNPSSIEVIELQRLVLEHCDHMGDRFAILDSFNGGDVDTIRLQKQQLVGDNGALYAPWLTIEGAATVIPPCGHIAGVYARSDRDVGAHRAPANYLLDGVLDISTVFSDTDWQYLNPTRGSGVNCIRSFRSRGIRVWGARTLSQVPEWQYVNIRRLIITVLRWADKHLADVVFEANTPSLWMRLERELTVYCESLWQQGALKGDDPEEAFYVKCDEETNPLDVRDVGQVVIEVGLAPTTPAEFIVISLVHGSSGVTFAQAPVPTSSP